MVWALLHSSKYHTTSGFTLQATQNAALDGDILNLGLPSWSSSVLSYGDTPSVPVNMHGATMVSLQDADASLHLVVVRTPVTILLLLLLLIWRWCEPIWRYCFSPWASSTHPRGSLLDDEVSIQVLTPPDVVLYYPLDVRPPSLSPRNSIRGAEFGLSLCFQLVVLVSKQNNVSQI